MNSVGDVGSLSFIINDANNNIQAGLISEFLLQEKTKQNRGKKRRFKTKKKSAFPEKG